MADKRVFYACQAVYLDGSFLKNVQAVGLDYANSNESIVDRGREFPICKYQLSFL